jgi:TolB-like protein/DNA-binding SARP family transcriptional activator/Tfp pilus assembly protein PilF
MIELRMLGSLGLLAPNGRDLQAVLRRPKRLALLAYLATARPQGFRRRDTLVALLWPDLNQSHARNALRQAVHFLRDALGHEVIVARGDEELAVDPLQLRSDVAEFEDLHDAGNLESALALYHGDLLAGFHVSRAPDFEHWVDQEREHVRKRAVSAALSLAGREESAGSASTATRWAREALDMSPYDENAFRRLLGLMDRAGDRAEAVREYDVFARRLVADLDVPPAPETRSLIDAIRARAGPACVVPTGSSKLMLPDGAAMPHLKRRATDGSPVPILSPVAPRVTAFVGGTLIVVLGIWGFWQRRVGFPSRSATRVAFIPFASLNGTGRPDYFNVGITAELVSQLSKIAGLRVIAPASIARTAEQAEQDVRRVADKLGVHTILTGSVAQAKGRVRIAAHLVDLHTSETVWAETYERELGNIFHVQADIAREIAEALAVEVGKDTSARLAHTAARSPKAYLLFLKGRYFLEKRTEEGIRKAIQFFQAAVDQDQEYAVAYAGLAKAYGLLSAYRRPNESLAAGRAFAIRAIELDGGLAEARVSLAFFRHFVDWDWDGASREYNRALRLDPQSAETRQWYGLLLRDVGRLDEALNELRRALELDPLSPTINRNLGYLFFCSGRYDEAIEQLRWTLELEPNFPLGHEWLRDAYAEVGRYDDALAEQVKVAALQGWRLEALQGLRNAYVSSGWCGVLEQILVQRTEASHRVYISPAVLAAYNAVLGRTEEAFRFLDQALRERDPSLMHIKTNPMYRTLRSDPRFDALIRRMGLPS